MKKILLTLLALMALTSPVQAQDKDEGKISLGGILINTDGYTIDTAGERAFQRNRFQYIINGSYTHQENTDGSVKMSRGFGGAKANYALDQKQYVFMETRYDYNKFRRDPEHFVAAPGYGYKIARTKNFRASNEVSAGIIFRRSEWEPVIRNSLWLKYTIAPNTSVSNKLLVERSSETFIRNILEIEYNISKDVTFGLKNQMVHDPRVESVTSFNLGVKF
jgi:putative salt-induced outer membrane protein YdiY